MQSSLLYSRGLHIALIPDGNGRWATRRGLPRRTGHLAGLRRVEESVRAAADTGISVLSLFAFSRLNWHRPDPEVRFLMRVFRRFFLRAARACPARGIRVVGIGRRHRLPTTLRDALEEAEAATERQAGMILRVAVDYSSRDAIREAATRIARLPEIPPDVFSRLLADPGPVTARYFPREARRPPPLPSVRHPAAVRAKSVLLVNPFYRKDPSGSFMKHALTPALALPSIAAATPPDWRVKLWDENLLRGPPPARPVPAVAGITVHLTFTARAYELARWFRRRGAAVVLGGPHVTAMPEEAARHADAIAIGDGVVVWPEILEDAAAGRLRPVYRGSYRLPLDLQPPPRRDVIPLRSFLTTQSMIATRGCHNRCSFCYLSTEGLAMPYQVRDPRTVVDEIAASGEPYAVFIDNNLGSRPGYLRALCRELRPAGIIWSAAGSLDVADDPALIRAMAAAGCTGVFVGFESITEANLIEARKRSPHVADFGRRIRLFHDHGIQVNGSFVLGFDHDEAAVFDRTIEWIERHRLECATLQILTPYPGTPLFTRLEAEGRILTRDWSRYDTAHVVFRPRRMDPETLEDGYRRCYRELFRPGSIWRRRPDRAGAVPSYLATSLLYKHLNPVWLRVIRHGLTAAVWRPLLRFARWRHRNSGAVARANLRIPNPQPGATSY